jgi:crossover junction endodeoxyribonuclease RuvC
MFERVVAGVDPGTASVGVAVVQGGARPSVLAAGTIRTPAGMAAAERLRRIHAALGELLDAHSPDSMAIERLMWNRNAQSAMEVARASGVAMLAAAERGLVVEEYGPLEVKMAVTGVGNATKDAVRRGLERILRLEGIPDEPDAADAVAVAVCHLQQSRLRALARGAAR